MLCGDGFLVTKSHMLSSDLGCHIIQYSGAHQTKH